MPIKTYRVRGYNNFDTGWKLQTYIKADEIKRTEKYVFFNLNGEMQIRVGVGIESANPKIDYLEIIECEVIYGT